MTYGINASIWALTKPTPEANILTLMVHHKQTNKKAWKLWVVLSSSPASTGLATKETLFKCSVSSP